MSISAIPELIKDFASGKLVILIDEEDRENEGDLLLAADFVTHDAINFMAREGRGLICLTLTEARCRQLNLPLMVARNRSALRTNFTVSIDAADGIATGISAHDRARTIQAAMRGNADDIVQPGHIFPLQSQPGGVLARAGHTEAGCDLAALAGLNPAAVICEILQDNGEVARLPELIAFAKQHGLKIGAIADLIRHRAQTESLVEKELTRPIATARGELTLHVYRDKTAGATHLALVKGKIDPAKETLVRVHEPLSVIDLLDVANPRHSWNFNDALKVISEAGAGVIVLLHRTESATDLLERARPSKPKPPEKIDLRDYGIGAQILRDLGVGKMRLLAAPRKMPSMAGFGLQVTGYLRPGSRIQD
ncbi:MAG: bifunctional 3,4-dihydroxy-2-butanone-4-phosphate synthase/GTP cyclohydrolase II [Burkholderiales bacterium]